jgi:hypothetical protein
LSRTDAGDCLQARRLTYVLPDQGKQIVEELPGEL